MGKIEVPREYVQICADCGEEWREYATGYPKCCQAAQDEWCEVEGITRGEAEADLDVYYGRADARRDHG